MSCFWSDHESVDDLKHKLLLANLELESAKNVAKQERDKTRKTVTHFLYLLNVALREKEEAQKQRDEAINQLQTLLDKISSFQPHVHSQQLPTPKGSVNNVSNTSHSHFHASSPTTCSLPYLTSTDSSNSGLPNQQQCVSMRDDGDGASFVYDSLIRGKPLPEKGRLVQAVLEAGPLLHTLLLAPLPQWNNPPPPTLPPLPLLNEPFNLPNANQSGAAFNPRRSSNLGIHHGHGAYQIPSSSVFEQY
ncbi:hypothetical protein TorRG33x02_014130 [Trema orientale]|uniref:Uncharacterized protein n=1 Tax=Trema orientale TaxID=63057 RepID=A0A2P5FXC1_TREOI|nr:hypothetical protein TorRG33x02_014130 [Trema orientale]